jgi:hypothetical protein
LAIGEFAQPLPQRAVTTMPIIHNEECDMAAKEKSKKRGGDRKESADWPQDHARGMLSLQLHGTTRPQ